MPPVPPPDVPPVPSLPPVPPPFDPPVPQLLAQLPLHNTWPAGQPQAPPLQTCPPGQGAPQRPQFAMSVDVLTQLPLQFVDPLGQVVVHWLPAQT
jgi:hypothetical protein